jgi:phosphoglycolate phosphatase
MNTVSSIKGLLFDKDGTLLDFAKTWSPINRDVAMYAAGGNARERDRLLTAGGYDLATGALAGGSIFSAAGLEATAQFLAQEMAGRVPADLRAEIGRLYREGGAAHAVLLDGAAQAIDALRAQRFVLGIATNDTADGMEASLQRCGIRDAFSFRVGCDSGYGSKPEPGMIHAFCRATGLAAEAVAMIGDTAHDMETGARAGVGLKIAVLSGTSSRAELADHADVILPSVAELPGWLRQSGASPLPRP